MSKLHTIEKSTLWQPLSFYPGYEDDVCRTGPATPGLITRNASEHQTLRVKTSPYYKIHPYA